MSSIVRPVVLSAIQPSGRLTLGNYLGALKHWPGLSDSHDCHYLLADLHAITQPQDPLALRERCYEFLALYLAAGIDPERNTLFVQSHVPAHAELSWILMCHTPYGELGRMTQFKSKSAGNAGELRAGLFAYPVLMAADILLYQTNLVPVGHDQSQHLELTRNLAERFNQRYGETFTLPAASIPPVGARIMGLVDPTAKMSKSGTNENDAIYLLDPPAVIQRKLQRAMTDGENSIRFDPVAKPGVSNLLTILSALTGEACTEFADQFTGRGYGPFKAAVADAVIAALAPIQARYEAIRADTAGLRAILHHGAEAAARKANHTLERVHNAIGFIPK